MCFTPLSMDGFSSWPFFFYFSHSSLNVEHPWPWDIGVEQMSRQCVSRSAAAGADAVLSSQTSRQYG